MTRTTLRLSGASGVAEAARLLRGGGLVAFATETVYGLGALALEPLAVRGIYAAKGRPLTNPLIVHVLGAAEARALVTEWPDLAQRLADAFWPGPLTLVLPRRPVVPDEVTAGGPTVAVRAPAHPLARALLTAVGAPLAAPSANRAEHVSPTTAAHVLADLDGRIDAVLDGGPCEVGIESTVLQLGAGGPRLLRQGSIPAAQLEALCGKVARGAAVGAGLPTSGAPAASPGLHARHYAPAGIVRLARGAEVAVVAAQASREAAAAQIGSGATVAAGPLPARVGALLHTAAAPPGVVEVRLPADAAGYAKGLYAGLRALEDSGCAAIVIEEAPAGSGWDAVRDRVSRASA